MPVAAIWSKSKPEVEFQYGGRLGESTGMSFQSQTSHYKMLQPEMQFGFWRLSYRIRNTLYIAKGQLSQQIYKTKTVIKT